MKQVTTEGCPFNWKLLKEKNPSGAKTLLIVTRDGADLDEETLIEGESRKLWKRSEMTTEQQQREQFQL